MLKGQTSIELGIILAFLMIIFMFLLDISFGNDSQITQARRQFSADTVGEEVLLAINSVYTMGEGSQKTLFLPSVLDPNEPYNISIIGRSIEVKWTGKRHVESAMTSNVNSTNLSSGRKIVVKNIGGRIIIG